MSSLALESVPARRSSRLPPLHQAIVDDDSQKLAYLLKRSTSSQQTCSLGFTPLQLAQALGRQSCLRYLTPAYCYRIKVGSLGSARIDLLTPREFQQWTGVGHTPHVEMEYKTLCFAARCCRRGHKKGHFDAERAWLSRWHGPELTTGATSDCVVKWVDTGLGYGLFAERDLSPHAYIGIYAGCLIRRDLLLLRTNDYCFRYPTGVETMRPLMIDAEAKGNELRYANHSDRPNMDGIGVPYGPLVHVVFRTNRAVQAGEQLTYDYGVDFWKAREIPKKAL